MSQKTLMGGNSILKIVKVNAVILMLAIVGTSFCACGKDPDATATSTTAATTTTTSATTEEETTTTDPSELNEMDIEDVDDDTEDEKILIWTSSNSFKTLLSNYTDVDYEIVVMDANTYQTRLDQVLATGEGAPDLFVCEYDYADKYMYSEYTLSVNELGISYDELDDMYDYTLYYACDGENVVKGLTWEAYPSAVIYNRDVAEEYLGVREPEDVAPFFADWGSFQTMATELSIASEGSVRAVSGIDDVWRSYTYNRTDPWNIEGSVTVDSAALEFLGFATDLYDNNCSFMTSQFDGDWFDNMANDSVLSYWGPSWLINMLKAESPYDKFGVVRAPTDFAWGEHWIMASCYCDMRASAAQIMRDLTLNEENLLDMADDGTFVNSESIMAEYAADETQTFSCLDGQNPYSVFDEAARSIESTHTVCHEQVYNDAFIDLAYGFVQGDIDSEDDFITAYEEELEARGLN